MTLRYHSGSASLTAGKETAKVRELINELNRRVDILEGDIAREQDLAGITNPLSPTYPVLARTMAEHRNNLKQTIAALERRLLAI
jgi:hypothetical protein